MSTITCDLDNLKDEKCPLYVVYKSQCNPQKAYIELDQYGKISATYDPNIGNSTSIDVWHNLTLRISCPNFLKGNALIEYLTEDEVTKTLQALHDMHTHTIKWDGSNYSGYITDDMQDIMDSIKDDLHRLDGCNIY